MKKSNLILSALLLCIAVLIGLVVTGNSESTADKLNGNSIPAVNSEATKSNPFNDKAPSQSDSNTPRDLDQLAQQLAAERETREKLQLQVDKLQEQVNKLTQHTALTVDSAKGGDNREDKTISTATRNIPQQVSGWVDTQRLTEAGMTKEQADGIRQLYENVEMEKLYLRDRAQREGWMASQRFRDEMDKLDERTNNLRGEIGEQAYDALLYATGRPNRVIVDGTLGNSPAAQAGIKQGDAILRYADKPIYSWYDLRTATTEGDANEMVALEILRGNKHMEFYVKRGPLGIRLDQQSINPSSNN